MVPSQSKGLYIPDCPSTLTYMVGVPVCNLFTFLSLLSKRLLLLAYLSIGLKNFGWIDIMTRLIRSFIYTFLNLTYRYMFCVRKVREQRCGPPWLGIFGMGGSILLGICSFVSGRLGIRTLFFDMIMLGHQHNDLPVYCTFVTCNLFIFETNKGFGKVYS